MPNELIKTIGAIFRVRQLLRIEQAVKRAVEEAEAHDATLEGTPPQYNDAQSPTGDDYNELWSIIQGLKDAT